MSFSIAVIGLRKSGKTNLLQHIKHGHIPEIVADEREYQVQYNGSNFQFIEIDELSHISNQFGAVLFCLDGSNLQELPQAKDFFDQVIDHLGESVILGVIQTKCDVQTIDVQELEQFLQKKGVVIGAVSTSNGEGIDSMMQWLQSELTQTHTRKVVHHNFEAEPRVVKSRGKYKINDQQTVSKSQQTFNNLMKEKRIRLLDPVQQEQEYVKLEKDRIKVENMYSQLNNFKKNKKKMTPYEIKPSANPRIQVNLEFFLTDSASTIEKTALTVDTQTDTFCDPPPSPPYVPKKTGIDAATQVEDYELFNFDREVTPILDVMISKSLEQACLEIEQEEEIQSMKRFKESFYKRRTQDKDNQKAVVQKEIDLITTKNEILKKFIEREERKNYLIRKAQAYQLAGRYFRDLQHNLVVEVFQQGFYPDNFKNQINTTYLDWLIDQTQLEVVKKQQVKQLMIGTFDSENLPPIKSARIEKDQMIQKKKMRAQRKQINQNSEARVIRIIYQDDKQMPSVVISKLPRLLDGTLDEYERNYETRLQEIDAKLEQEQMTEDEYNTIKMTEFPDIPLNYFGMSVHSVSKLGFALAHNQYYETPEQDRKLQPFALIVDKQGKYTIIDQTNQRDGKTIRYKDNFRNKKQKASDDTAIIIELESLHKDVCCVMFGFRLPNLQVNSQPQAIIDSIQHSRYGIYDTANRIPFDFTSIAQMHKFEELIKVQDNPNFADLPQTAVVFCYALTRRFKQFGKWFLESSKVSSKGLMSDEIPHFYTKISQFVIEQYENTLMMDQELIHKLLEREGDGRVFTLQDQNSVMLRRHIPSQKQNISINKESSHLEPSSASVHKEIDEPKEIPKSFSYSRVVKAVTIQMDQTFEQSEAQIIKHLQSTEPALIESCKDGFEIHVRKQPFLLQKQFIRLRTIGEMVLIRKPEPIPEKVENAEDLNDNLDPQPNDD